MAATIKIQAREIVRAAKRKNIKMAKFDYNRCILGMVGHMADFPWLGHPSFYPPTWKEELADKVGRPMDDLKALEAGFEGWDQLGFQRNRYYKVGQRVAEMVGIV